MALTINAGRLPDPRVVKKIASDLIEAEDAVARLRAEWTALFNSPPQEDEAGKGTLSDRIEALLNERVDETFTAPMVTQTLGANPNSVGPLLSRLVADQKVRKVGHGEYRGRTPLHPWPSTIQGMPVEDVGATEKGPEALAS